MFTIALFFIVPLFLYCSYLFAKDIKSSYSMYSFKRDRLKVGNNSSAWKPVPLHQFATLEQEYATRTAPPTTTQSLPEKNSVSAQQQEVMSTEKPVIKLYKDADPVQEKVSSQKSFSTGSTEKLLRAIAQEKSQYDVLASNLLLSYQNSVKEYIDRLIGVTLQSEDNKSFIYPTDRIGKTSILCYLISEAGITEKHLEIADVIKYKPLSNNDVTGLIQLVSEYENIKTRIQAFLAGSNNKTLNRSKSTSQTFSENVTDRLPLSILKDLSDNEVAISKVASGMVSYRP